MRGFLRSFGVLTDSVRAQQHSSTLEGVGNTGPAMQTIGFHNIPLVVEGTLLKQAYQIAQARYELALSQYAQGRNTDHDVVNAKRAYEEATRSFQAFWDTKRPVCQVARVGSHSFSVDRGPVPHIDHLPGSEVVCRG